MKKTPLFAAHLARNATTEILGDWLLPSSYGDTDAEVRAAARGAVVFDLANVGKVLLAGDQVRRFCNGMFSNNIKKLKPGQGNRSVCCDDRGRVQGVLDLYCVDDTHFLAVLDGVSTAWFEGRYELYAELDDIERTLLDEAPWVLSVQGPEAAQVLARLGLPAPEADHGHALVAGADGDGLRVCRKDRTGLGGFDLLVPTDALQATWEALLAAGATPAGHDALDALRIAAGRARWPEDGTDKSMVHELRYNVECCAFDKGCYVGQEVINRIDVKGQLTKRLTGLVMAEDALPPVGAEVVLGEDVLGTVTSAARVLGQPLALGVLRKAAWEPGTAVVVRAGDRSVAARTSDLPFEGVLSR